MTIPNSDLVLNDEEHVKLVGLMDRLGEVRLAEHLRIARMTLLRVLSRRPARLGTIGLVRIGLSKAV